MPPLRPEEPEVLIDHETLFKQVCQKHGVQAIHQLNTGNDHANTEVRKSVERANGTPVDWDAVVNKLEQEAASDQPGWRPLWDNLKQQSGRTAGSLVELNVHTDNRGEETLCGLSLRAPSENALDNNTTFVRMGLNENPTFDITDGDGTVLEGPPNTKSIDFTNLLEFVTKCPTELKLRMAKAVLTVLGKQCPKVEAFYSPQLSAGIGLHDLLFLHSLGFQPTTPFGKEVMDDLLSGTGKYKLVTCPEGKMPCDENQRYLLTDDDPGSVEWGAIEGGAPGEVYPTNSNILYGFGLAWKNPFYNPTGDVSGDIRARATNQVTP